MCTTMYKQYPNYSKILAVYNTNQNPAELIDLITFLQGTLEQTSELDGVGQIYILLIHD